MQRGAGHDVRLEIGKGSIELTRPRRGKQEQGKDHISFL